MSDTGPEGRALIRKYWMPVFVLVSILYIAYYLFSQLDQAGGDLKPSVMPLLVSALFQVSFWALSSHLWSVVLFAVSAKRVPIADSFFQLCLVNLGKYIPGKVWGMVARASYAQQKHGIDMSRNIQATYFEQIYLLGAGAIVASVIAAILWSNPLLWVLAPVVSVAVVVATIYQRPMTLLMQWINKLRKTESDLGTYEVRLSPALMFGLLLRYMIVWVLLGMVMYCLYLALFPGLVSVQMAAVVTLACIAGMSAGFVAIFAPGGVGVREAVSGAILAAYMPLSDAVLVVLLFRIWLAALEVLAGGALYLRHRRDAE